MTGWRVPDVAWSGVRVADLLDEAGADGAYVRFLSSDGVYSTTLTMDQARRDDVIVATQMEGERSAGTTADRSGSTWPRCTATSP